jgi:outer membrane protein assembly factor BamB
MNQRLLRLSIQAVFLHIVFVSCLRAEDWPTPRHDQRRSGVCRETIDATKLVLKWTWNSSLPPASAWPDAAKWDAYASLEGLQSMRNYDPVMHPIVAKQFVYLPSNSDDTVRCLRLADGSEVWSFTANAPVRIAPTFFENKVYFGSDDGRLYCVQSETGGTAMAKSSC